MDKNENLDPEPPELRQQGVPPLKRIVKYIFIAIAIAVVIVLAFSIYFKATN
jgi:cell division protein FtsL